MQTPRRLHPAQVERARRDSASRQLAALGGRIELKPTQALLECVYRAAGQAAWLQQKLQSLSDDEILCRGPHGAVVPHSGVAERQVRIAERTGQLIAAALEEALGPLRLASADRAAVVKRFVSGLTALEEAPEEP